VEQVLALIGCLGYCLALGNEIEQPSEAWDLPRTGTRALLGESDHKYKIHDRIKLYGETLYIDDIARNIFVL